VELDKDIGVYTCVGENRLGESEGLFYILGRYVKVIDRFHNKETDFITKQNNLLASGLNF